MVMINLRSKFFVLYVFFVFTISHICLVALVFNPDARRYGTSDRSLSDGSRVASSRDLNAQSGRASSRNSLVENLQLLVNELQVATNDSHGCAKEAVRAAAMPFVRAVENHVWLKETVEMTEGLRTKLVADMLDSLMEVVRDNARRKPKVLVHSMARSGSSLLAELLSLSPDAAYVFEPIKSIRFTDSALHLWGTHEIEKIAPMMQGIFTCHPFWLNTQKNLARLTLERCWNANPLVVKTIRLRLNKIEEWASRNKLDWLKVIHLVRDPRARYNSLMNNKKDFINAGYIFNHSCQWEMEDIQMKHLLPPGSYTTVRYEDLVSDLMSKMRELYSFIGIPFTKREEMLVKMHTEEPSSSDGVGKEEYYSTYRSKDFNPNQWMDSLSLNQIRMVEAKCKDVLVEYGYKTFNSKMKKK